MNNICWRDFGFYKLCGEFFYLLKKNISEVYFGKIIGIMIAQRVM